MQQAMYFVPAQHNDIKRHMGFGLYAFFTILQLISEGHVDGFSSEIIHFTRPALASFLAQDAAVSSMFY